MSHVVAVLTLAVLVAAGGPALAAQAPNAPASKASGTIVSVDGAKHTLTLAEMGPWHGPQTKPTDHAIALAPAAQVELVTRSTHPAPDGWIGGYVESPLSLDQLRPGDFATVTLAHQGGRLVATSVDVVRPTGK